jgi:hypothetical protein
MAIAPGRCLMVQVMRLHPMMLGLALAAAAVSGCAKPGTVTGLRSSPGEALVRSLADPKARDTAYCELLSLRLYHRPKDAYKDTCGPVSEVVTAPQPRGSPLYIVFTKPEYEIEREPIRRGPAGPFSIFDSNGYIVPVFSSANVVNYESELFTYSPAGEVAIGNVFGVTHGSAFDAGHWSVQTLNIIPVTVGQKSALSVVLGPPTFGFDDGCAGNFWSWRYGDADADGRPEIQIGPRVDAEGNITPTATFRWSSDEQKYVGPTGSVAEQFIQFEPDDRKAFDAYAEAWRGMQEKRTGRRLSWCRSGAGGTSSSR